MFHYSLFNTMLFKSFMLICLTIVIIYFFCNWCQKVFFIKRLNLPESKAMPLLGTSYIFLYGIFGGVLNVVNKITENYPSPLQFHLAHKVLIGIYEPDQIKIVLRSKNCLDKSIIYKYGEPLFGTGLLTAPVHIWTRSRRMIAPIFNAYMLKKFFEVFVKEALVLNEELEQIAQNNNKIVFLKYVAKCVLKITCDTIDVKMETDIFHQFMKATKRLKEIARYRFWKIYLHPNIIFNLTAMGREQKKILNFMQAVTDKMIQQRINHSNTVKYNDDTTDCSSLDMLIASSHIEKFTRKEICDNIITLIITGNDSITFTTHLVIFMLANFPEIQEKVYKEMLDIYGMETPNTTPVKYDDIQRMHYLDCVVKETLRIFPTVPLIGRKLMEDLKIGDHILPKGIDVVIPIIHLHRNKKYWPNPLTFNPDRFLPDKIKDRPSYYYIPFGDGPRNCIGMNYGMIAIKVILATLVRAFIFKVDKSIDIKDIQLNTYIILSTIKPLEVKIEKRNLQQNSVKIC
ncbi:hypothetical protein P5V15_004553 [Pogonomyrmex californicus]